MINGCFPERISPREAFSGINPATRLLLSTTDIYTAENDGFAIAEELLEKSRPAIQSTIMKKSKLDPYREFILKRLQSSNINQIRTALANEGFSVSHSNLCEWIETLATSLGIELPPRVRGRPVKSKPAIFGFLPPEGEQDKGLGAVPHFILILQNIPPELVRQYRKATLDQLGLSNDSNASTFECDSAKRLMNLSDLELCLLALLRSDLPSPPLSNGPKEFKVWFKNLVECAYKLRKEIREACQAQTSS